MSSGAEKLRFGKKRPNRSLIFILIVVVLLAIIGFFSWPLIKNRLKLGSSAPESIAIVTENTPSPEARPAEGPEDLPGAPAENSPPADVTETIVPNGAPAGEAAAETARAGAGPEGPVVTESSVRQILGNVMAAWVTALDKGDFSQFHQMISASWQQKDSPTQLKATFGVLSPYLENLRLFPSRGKLVLLESRPFSMEGQEAGASYQRVRDNLGPESPWLVRGEWRVNKTALSFTLVLNLEAGQWKPTGLKVEIFN
ncbi:MAG: hypothetical protein LBF38_11915 [Deltaproteobacteria bacterium]|jgi:hypothetical protein|nr:hypothetical protein [Deltaproteobacteria bacterium]